MTTVWTIVAVTLLGLALAAGWVLTLLGLPGTWLIVLGGVVYAAWGPADERLAMATLTVMLLAVLAVIGEILEFVLGAVSARRAGGSRRAAVGALGGGLAGALVGMFVGIPIPIIGSVIAAVFFAAAGAMAGAYAAQRSMNSWTEAQKAWRIGKAAFWGRLGGTVAKLAVATLMVGVCVASIML